MAAARLPDAARNAPWAAAALALLTALNFLNYVDRYVLAAVLERIRLDPAFSGASDAQLGGLQTAFFYSYMMLSPLSGLLARRTARRYVVAAGVLLWSVATVASGLARGYDELLAARALIGCGEAGYATVAPALISDLFRRDLRNRVLSIFYLATPVGSALGFVIGGLTAQAAGWRAAFFVAGFPGVLLALVALLLPEPGRGAQEPAEAGPERSFVEELRSLLRNPRFLRVTAGTTLMTFAVGGLAFWMPTWLQQARGLDTATANTIVGGLAVLAGVLGTALGAVLGDAWFRRDRRGYLRLSATALLLAAPFAVAIPFSRSATGTATCLALAEFFVFLTTGPLNTALVESVGPRVRETAVGIHIFFIHALGDAISPPLVGALAGALTAGGLPHARALGLAVSAVAAPLLLGGIVLLVGPGRSPAPGPEEC